MASKGLKRNHYRCATCKGVFVKGRPDSVALAEFHDRHPDIPEEETEIVCDECFKNMKGWFDMFGKFEDKTIN